MRWSPFALVLLLAAGCGDPPGDAAPAVTDSGATSTTSPSGLPDVTGPVGNGTPALPSVLLRECHNWGMTVDVDAAEANAVLPEGFEAVQDGGQAVAYVIVLNCVVNGTEDGAWFGYAELAVTPPAELRVAGITDCTVPLAFGASDPTLAQQLAEWGFGVTGEAALSFQATAVGPLAVQQLTLEFADVSLTMRGLPEPDPLSFTSGRFAMYGVVERQVRSIVVGGADVSDAAAQGVLMQLEVDGVEPLDGPHAGPGFMAQGFHLQWQQVPLPA